MEEILECPSCATKLKIRPEYAGRQVRCPKCSTILTVPASGLQTHVIEELPPEARVAVSRSDREAGSDRHATQRDDEGRDFDRPAKRSPKLDSLAQAARGKQLRGARILFAVLGILTLLLSLYPLLSAREIIQKAIRDEIAKKGPGFIPDPASVRQVEERGVRILRLAAIVDMCLGCVFIFLAVIVYRYPVAATVVGLVLYVSIRIIVIVLNPGALSNPLWAFFAVLFTVALAMAVRTAIVYQRERDAERRWREEPEEDYESSPA